MARVKGIVHIDEAQCKGCELCIAECEDQVLYLSSHRNKKGYLVPAARPDLCRACMKCELICPEFAIQVEVIRP